MTVRVTTLKGGGAGRYYTHHLPSYYLDGNEPPGRWWGRAGAELGLAGEICPEAFQALLDGQHPLSGDHLGRRMGEGAVRGFDATFSAPKSVSVLFGLGDETIRGQVVEAHEAAVNAVLGWVEDHAHTRLRVHGHMVCVDAEGIVVGVFRQHTSRRLDPQLHTHAVIANRVLAPDGRWLTLDARTIKMDQRTLSALYHVGLRAELTRRLGVGWVEPKHGIAEIADMPVEVLAEFSQRTTDIEERLEVKLARFRADLGRDPTTEERWRLEREAVTDSRPAKRHGLTTEDLQREWQERVRELGFDPAHLVQSTVGSHRSRATVDTVEMIRQAAETIADGQSSWRPAELLRELAVAFPATAGADAGELLAWLESVSDRVVAEQCVDLRPPGPTGTPVRRDGRPITEAATERRLTTQTILDQEGKLITWVERRLTEPSSRGRVDGRGLDAGQEEVAACVAGYRGLELVQGPAGAGKTTALAVAVASLRRQGRAVFGVAPTAAAAQVLATETGLAADTLDKLLVEHSLSERQPGLGYDLPGGATVIVDEAGTVATPALARLADLAESKNWRVVLVGDPRQFAAVGRGGMFANLVNEHGSVELDQVHRFRHDWERRASLQLRKGQPEGLIEYDQRGRLHGGTTSGMELEIIDAWQAARSRGETVALMANSNQAVDRLNRLAQMNRLLTGEISFRMGGVLRVGGQVICVGDDVVTRRNERTLRTDQGVTVKNRHHWTVDVIHPDGSITATGETGTIRLPADYVATHLRLGYAETSHATQGRTVDTALLLVDSPTDLAGIYTPMTRGRETNHAYAVTEDNQTPVDVLTQAVSRQWIDQPATSHTQPDPVSPGVRGRSKEEEIEQLMDHARRSIEKRRQQDRGLGGRSLP